MIRSTVLPIDVTIAGGTHGDRSTAAIVNNVIPRVVQAQPGLVTMKDLLPFPVVS